MSTGGAGGRVAADGRSRISGQTSMAPTPLLTPTPLAPSLVISSSDSPPSSADLVALARSCGARHISLRACPPGLSGGHGVSAAARLGVTSQPSVLPVGGHVSIGSFMQSAPCLGRSMTTGLGCSTFSAVGGHGMATRFGVGCSPFSVVGGHSMGIGLGLPNFAGVTSLGYYQSLLNGFAGDVSAQEQFVAPETEAFISSSCTKSSSRRSTSSAPEDGNISSCSPASIGGYVEALIDSDEDEIYVSEEDSHCNSEESEEEKRCKDDSSDEDVDAPTAPLEEEQDPALKYEICATPLGDCGCVSKSYKTKKRIRWPKGVDPPDCRLPRAMGTIEKAMRNSKNRIGPFIFEPVLGMVFDSRAEAYQFYNLYSWEVGFGIRFGTSARNRVNKYRTMQELVCEREGFDSRCTSSSKRNYCKAML
ncbi:unnamed protein product [Urochloa humidicola]